MIRSKMFPVIFFVMVFSSCHLIAKDKRAENNPGEKAANRGLAASGEPLYQICTKHFRNGEGGSTGGPLLEVFGGKTTRARPYRILSDTECLWVKESDFKWIHIRVIKTVRSVKYSNGYEANTRLICVSASNHIPCKPGNYVFNGGQALRHRISMGDFRDAPLDMFMEISDAIPQPNLPKSQIYQTW